MLALSIALTLCITAIAESDSVGNLSRETDLSTNGLSLQDLLDANHVNYTDLSPEDIAHAMDLSQYNITDLFETDFCSLVDLNQTDANYLVMKLEPEVMLLEQQAEKKLRYRTEITTTT